MSSCYEALDTTYDTHHYTNIIFAKKHIIKYMHFFVSLKYHVTTERSVIGRAVGST